MAQRAAVPVARRAQVHLVLVAVVPQPVPLLLRVPLLLERALQQAALVLPLWPQLAQHHVGQRP